LLTVAVTFGLWAADVVEVAENLLVVLAPPRPEFTEDTPVEIEVSNMIQHAFKYDSVRCKNINIFPRTADYKPIFWYRVKKEQPQQDFPGQTDDNTKSSDHKECQPKT
jgi:hypothetical protein